MNELSPLSATHALCRVRPARCPTLLVASALLLQVGCSTEAQPHPRAPHEPYDEVPTDRDDDEAKGAVDEPADAAAAKSEPRSPRALDAGAHTAEAGREAGADARAVPADGSQADAARDAERATKAGADGGPSSAAGGVMARCSGKPGAKQGKSSETIRVGSAMRKFVMHRPVSLDADTPAPIVIVPHGYTQTGEDMYRITKYWELGDKEGIVTIYPDGASAAGPWNVGSPTCQSTFGLLPLGTGDDQAFLAELVKFVEADQCVDREHVFIAGFSMGGYLANETGCKSQLVRAIAPHSAGSYELASCPGPLKPVLMIHGSGDRLIPYDCGKQTRERWVKRNGCSDEVEVRMVQNGTCEYHKDCKPGGQVAFCTLRGMNHGWAGGPTSQVAVYPDDYPKYESSTEVSWSFFRQYAW